MHPWGISGWVWCSSDARRTWGIWLRLKLLAIIPGSCPARLKGVGCAAALITILCWPDGWLHWAGMHDSCLVPCVVGSCPLGREGPLGCHVGPYTWRSSFPRSGSYISNIPRGFLYLSAGVFLIGKIGGHVRLLPLPKKKRKKNPLPPTILM